MQEKKEAIRYLRQLANIRKHAKQVFVFAQEGKTKFFSLHLKNLDRVCDFIIEEIKLNYPSGKIPPHGRLAHFQAGGVDRLIELKQSFKTSDERLDYQKSLFEVLILSVLMDAGAGSSWSFYEESSKNSYKSSEGLAICIFDAFKKALFSRTEKKAWLIEASTLNELKISDIENIFQVRQDNPLAGVKSRFFLIKKLAHLLAEKSYTRLGDFYPELRKIAIQAQDKQETYKADEVFSFLLNSFESLWPQGYDYDGVNLGDVGVYPGVKGTDQTHSLIPFHKLTLWMSYSVLDFLQAEGASITNWDTLPGLAEYRNGGLFIDLELIRLKDKNLLTQAYSPQSQLVVEWRALSISLLDLLLEKIKEKTKNKHMTLAMLLQGGTWSAGRRLAKQLREDGSPPIKIILEGSTF